MAETVCVTGASGFIASWIVKKLLEKGYRVKATVRDKENVRKYSHLLRLPFADERLEIVEADLLKAGSFHEAFRDCAGIFHTASPVHLINVTDPETELIQPAVTGTLNVLRAVKDSDGVKKVVLTSSLVAVRYFQAWDYNVPLDESCWSEEKICTEKKMWYALSKTRAEQTAWEFCKSNSLNLVVINPTMVVGKLLQPEVNESSSLILSYLTGNQNLFPFKPHDVMGWVHVEDVADSHILAYENPESEGRYICIETFKHMREVLELLKSLQPSISVNEQWLEAGMDGSELPKFSNEKVKKLGVRFRPIEIMMKDCVDSLKEAGHFSLES